MINMNALLTYAREDILKGFSNSSRKRRLRSSAESMIGF
jgi:hypothetical protein